MNETNKAILTSITVFLPLGVLLYLSQGGETLSNEMWISLGALLIISFIFSFVNIFKAEIANKFLLWLIVGFALIFALIQDPTDGLAAVGLLMAFIVLGIYYALITKYLQRKK